jgi:anti-sigma regulatory factor (Ser/Thr protein kinase)
MPTDETARLAALRSYRILDTDPEAAFDDLTLLASQICGTPMAAISLIDDHRQWFKSKVGLSFNEVSRSVAFCTHAMGQQSVMIVPDATQDHRFRDNPMVTGEPHLRFYAGAPIMTPDGHALGALCVVDSEPRTLTDDQTQALDALRRQVQSQLELRRNLVELGRALVARDIAEAAQDQLIKDLRDSVTQVNKLTALIPYTSTCELNMVIPATPAGIHMVSEGVMQLLQRKHWGEDDIIKIDLALQEALANGIRHGCKGDPTKSVQCSVTCDENGELMIVVRDPGPGFDLSQVANPLDSENMLKPSGRGVFLINQLMDQVAFADGGREVKMRKRRDKSEKSIPAAPTNTATG